MKRLICFVFALVLVTGLCACKKSGASVSSTYSDLRGASLPSDKNSQFSSGEHGEDVNNSGAVSTSDSSDLSNKNCVPKAPKNQTEPRTDSSQTYGGEDEDSSSNEASETENAVDKLREDYNLGACKNLSGDVAVILFYMEDSQDNWSETQAEHFTATQIKPALAFLENEANKRGINLKLSIKETHLNVFYNENVIRSVKETGLATADVLWIAANGIGYTSDNRMIESKKSQYGTDEVICLTVFNKDGTSYALNPKRGTSVNAAEHCIVFAYDYNSDGSEPEGAQASVIAHEILHLYGAEDFYDTTSRKALAAKYYPFDIMLGAEYNINFNNIGDATAFYIGWTNNVPDPVYNENW